MDTPVEETKRKTVKDVVQEVVEGINKTEITENDNIVIEEMKMLISDLKGNGVNSKDFRLYTAQELSRIAGSLALLKSSLSDIIAKAGRNMRITEAYIKLRKGNLLDKITKEFYAEHHKTPTVGYIKGQTNRLIFQDRVKYAFLEEFHEKTLYLWRASNSILDVIQTRIQVLMSERGDTKLMEDSVDYIGTDLPLEEIDKK